MLLNSSNLILWIIGKYLKPILGNILNLYALSARKVHN